MMVCYAVLIDTIGIQRYVFGSNKLKENLGASYLVESIYDQPLKETLKKIFNDIADTDIDKWFKEPDYIAINDGKPFEIAYIGGGNALLFFKDEGKAQKFIKEWTKQLLVYAPSLNTAVAVSSFDIDDFKNSKESLFKILFNNKSNYAPITIIPRHGITAECSHSGYSMDVFLGSEQKFVSSVVNAKIESSERAKKSITELFKDELGNEFVFTDEIGNLGQSKGEDSHIAIVHIDGNSMGERFSSQQSLVDLRKLSTTVKQATLISVKAMINAVKGHKKMLLDFIGQKKFPADAKKEILPFRPIIIGGDDITFIAEGRLGIWLAEQFLCAFQSQHVSDGNPLSACAGVAITKSKYPFYRGYSLSEQLCKSAKQKRKANGSKGSWIDFHIAYGGISGSIEQIRETQYKVVQGNLLMRPYCLSSEKPEYDFETLKENAKILSFLPNNKIKEMLKTLTLGKEETGMFVKEMKARGEKIPKINRRNFEDYLFDNEETPYFDMIELMEFYPGLKEASQ
ncbi:MAG: hypothetical protein N2738_03090 [Thermodesulfovibrionales bacterium]|nr:hypothetical protein [Thermodesulfovibrionales bacterium]